MPTWHVLQQSSKPYESCYAVKKFLQPRGGACKLAASIIFLVLIALGPPLSLAYVTRSVTDQRLGRSGVNYTTPGNISIDLQQGERTTSKGQRAMAVSACAMITGVQIVNPGNFYKVGDNLDPAYGTLCSPGDNYGFRLRVASVDSESTGRVTAVTIIPGIGYSAPPSNPIAFGGSPSGTGFTANCTFQ
jgi:hypothetical protein